MSIGFRHADHRYPFLWESDAQPAGRWHADGEGPCQYLADTPDGAWAEFLRHEEITDPADLAGIARSMWAIDVPDAVLERAHPAIALDMLGGPESYPSCQDYARDARARGVTELTAPSAALLPGAGRGQVTDGGLQDATARDGKVWALFGSRPDLRAWQIVERGSPPARLIPVTRQID